MNKKIYNQEIIDKILNAIIKYSNYNIKLKVILKLFGLNKSRFYNFKNKKNHLKIKSSKKSVNKITLNEEEKIIKYALKNTQYNHRELTYKMIDNNIAFISQSSCYRILKSHNLIKTYKPKINKQWGCNYQNKAEKPDELWQTDITYFKYKDKNIYQLSFIDIYSRFVVLSKTIMNMTSITVSNIFEEFITLKLNDLPRIPILQSDNGSCYIGGEFKSLLLRLNIKHNKIHPGTPTENAIIERYNKTFKELLYNIDEPDNLLKLQKITNEITYYYNFKRYHQALNYVTPNEYYRGNPNIIFKERKEKLALAKKERRMKNASN